jgi:small-conductance mechanosensitive channel
VARQWAPDQIIDLLVNIARDHPAVLAAPGPVARLVTFGADSYSYNLSYSIADPLKDGAVDADLRLAICRRFGELGIDPPC